MTQEQKAEAYSKAVEKAKQEYNTTTSEDRKQWLEELFPELKESEDERVRKAVFNFFNRGAKCGEQTNGVYDKDILAWLEKQTYTKKNIDDAYLKGVKNTKNEIEKQYEESYQIRQDIAAFIFFNYRGDIKDRAKWMDYLGIEVSFVEKQGELKLPIGKLPSEMKSIGESLGFTTQEDCDSYNQMVSDLIMSDDNKGVQKPAE